ncbi:MAG TPA: GNAT family N-acetyltransferase [Polyangiaceae bacterium]|nr:GNAT family N-acetyltransferase [Polyangiaceae bacterium]
MDARELEFRTIELPRDAALCVAFRRDAHAASFGPEQSGFDAAEYLSWLAGRLVEFPEGHLHVWRDEKIVGQLEMIQRKDPPDAGYVNLFYLVPEVRGGKLGGALHDYVTRFFRERGVRRLRLSVSPSNERAVRYYAKHGWTSLGPRPGDEKVHRWELLL